MLKIILLIVYLLLILTVIFIERKSPTEACLWVLIMICLPYFGVLLYLIFGNTVNIKITTFIRKQRLKKRRPESAEKNCHSFDNIKLSDEDAQVIRFNSTYNSSEITSYDNAKIFTDGESHYRSLFADIKNAKECIYAEFYTIHDDVMGRAFIEALAKKAREGVTVMVLCDFIANFSVPLEMYKPLKEAGGKLIRVKPYLTHYRSHRKIVAIDHEIGYIGGMNIGKQYANLAKVKNPWRDTQIRLEGVCTSILDEYFLNDWLCAAREINCGKILSYIESIPKRTPAKFDNLCQFIVGGVDTNKESVKMCYLSMIRSAKEKIRIQSPYFIPDASILDALKTAAAAGVEIEVMIPGIKASFFLDPVTRYYCGQLMEFGVKIYKYHGYIHAKTMTIDNEICCIGSVNMDNRSLMVDDEICGIFYNDDIVNEYVDIFKNDITNCDTYTYEEFNSRSRKDKISESFFLLFAPLM